MGLWVFRCDDKYVQACLLKGKELLIPDTVRLFLIVVAKAIQLWRMSRTYKDTGTKGKMAVVE